MGWSPRVGTRQARANPGLWATIPLGLNAWVITVPGSGVASGSVIGSAPVVFFYEDLFRAPRCELRQMKAEVAAAWGVEFVSEPLPTKLVP